MQVLVARIGRPHGLRGEVTIQVHTDVPRQRFAPGSQLRAEGGPHATLTVTSMRVHQQTTLLGFAEVPDRTAAEQLRGVQLFYETSASSPEQDSDEADGWYEDELIGLAVVTAAGAPVGQVSGLLIRPAQDLLQVRCADGAEVLIPFVEQIVPQVDMDQRRIVINPPDGLLDLAGD